MYIYMCCFLYRVVSAVISGTTYRKGTVVICGIEDDTPMFGSIAEIIVTHHQECFFVISVLITIAFQHHYHAYEVLPTDSIVVCHHGQFVDYHPLVCKKAVGRSHSLFISTKYHLFS